MLLYVIEGNVLTAFVGVIKQFVKAHGPLVKISKTRNVFLFVRNTGKNIQENQKTFTCDL